MAWTAPMTFVDGTPLTASQLNIYLRDNMNETEAAKATSKGGLMISTALNRIEERSGGSHIINTGEETTSTSYTDLETVGPTVTCNTYTRAMVFVNSQISLNVSGASIQIGIEVSGQTTKTAETVMTMDGFGEDKPQRFGSAMFHEDLTPGENTFTMKYRVPSGNTGTFSERSLVVIPF